MIIHPDVLRRRERIGALRMELAGLFDEYVRLSFDELPALRHRYGELFGALEKRTQERMLELRKRRRMVELFAIKIDRGQRLDAKMVELVMRAVMNENGEIDARVNRTMRSRDRLRGAPADETPRARATQGRDLYRRLARRLHPDARGGADPIARRYWDVVQAAYLRGDLDMLRALDHLLYEMGSGSRLPADALVAEEDRLEQTIRAERRRLNTLRETEPYTLRDALHDERWVDERRRHHEAELDGIEQEIAACNAFLDPIFESVRTNEPPHVVENLWSDFVERMYLSGRY
ncbi:MAG TPA: J domain-containing protein [Candidatus Kapabacteria bacterium]|nr:J domain-containing protein [Candidatus Kapabacteria bacterium]